jgi:hypothetical protein
LAEQGYNRVYVWKGKLCVELAGRMIEAGDQSRTSKDTVWPELRQVERSRRS